jgi:hypothetical protein
MRPRWFLCLSQFLAEPGCDWCLLLLSDVADVRRLRRARRRRGLENQLVPRRQGSHNAGGRDISDDITSNS